MGMILRIASSRIVGQGDIVGRSGYFSLNLSANSVMRGRLDARRTLKSLVADLRFNSLNTLIAEIEYNPSNAVRFTRNLSDVYRYVLQSQDKTLITLGEELEFIQSYLFLHEVRLGNCIACNITIPTEAMEYQLPPLTLQLLVENVIKHNSINSNKPMDITIQIVDHFLVVSNPIHAKKSDTTSGVGLQNLSNRCKLMIGTDIIINNENQIFTVKVPLIYE